MADSACAGGCGMTKGNWTAVMALVAISAPAPALEPAPKDQARATITHLATGFHFPSVVDGFNRVSIKAFNSVATDISIGYASLTRGSQVAVTVYVTPAPQVTATSAAQAQSCDKQFEAMDRRFTQTHPGARQLVRGDVRSPSLQYAGTGRQVIYDYEDVFYGQRQTLRSETDLYCYVGGNWLIAYRSTSPVQVDYAPKLATFMRQLVWPAPGSGQPVADAVSSGNAAPSNRVIVKVRAGQQQVALAGLVVTGSEADLARFEAAASQHGVNARRMTENGKTQSIASLLKPEITKADAADLFRSTRDGKYGRLTLEILLMPPEFIGEERDILSRAPIYPASAVEEF